MSDRTTRNKERTRAALVGAAQQFLAAGATAVSIQELTDAADVGFGSFYNHFSSKDELFNAAVAATLETWASFLEEVVRGIEDPAEIFAASFRMTGRLQRRHPELVSVLLNQGTAVLQANSGLRPRALADLDAGIRSGRFAAMEPEVAFMLAGAVLLGLLQMLAGDSEADEVALSDQFALRVLIMLGVDPTEAQTLVAAPLPLAP